MGADLTETAVPVAELRFASQSRVYVRKLDLSHLCFSLNFCFLMFLLQFPSMFLLLTCSQSFFSLSADYPRHSR